MVTSWRRALFTSIVQHSKPHLTPHNSSQTPPCHHHHHHHHLTPSPTPRFYDDDEPLLSSISHIQFHPIPESDEEPPPHHTHLTLSSSTASLSCDTSLVLLNLRAPPGSIRAFVDLVTVVDVGGDMTARKLHALKRAMRLLISSLSSNDRLSIVAFSSGSKRLLPLRRMTPSGRRSARRIIDALCLGQGACVNDALRKAVKVLHDRKEKNQFSTIILMDAQDDKMKENHSRPLERVSSTRFTHMEIPVHTFKVREELQEDVFVKAVNGFLSVVVLDLRFRVEIDPGSTPVEILAVYSCTDRPSLLSSSEANLGDLYSEEEREILVELKLPSSSSSVESNQILTVRSLYKDPSTKQQINGGDHTVMVPSTDTVRSSDPRIQRLRSMYVMTKAVAESRRLIAEQNDIVGAKRVLCSARAVLGDDFRRRVEAELAEVIWRRHERRRREKENRGPAWHLVDDAPISAWKAAERLAKVAIMRKSLNRVSDLHGFEDARF